jgi:deazaflavin-dependent oxidoreductase (nitroreductase family)
MLLQAEPHWRRVPGMYVPERKRNPFLNSATGGRILSALTLPRFTLLTPVGFGVLTTTGRKTGKKRRRCVRAIRDQDKAYVVSIFPTGWLSNVRANPNVHLRLRGGRIAGVARELREDERGHAMETYCETVNPFDYVECLMWRRGRPTRSKITELHRGWFEKGTPLVVELEK